MGAGAAMAPMARRAMSWVTVKTCMLAVGIRLVT